MIRSSQRPWLLLALLGVLALLSTRAAAQSLSGTVHDRAGHPLAEADVIIEPSGVRTRSDDEGRFTLRGVKPGEFKLRVRLVSFRPFEVTLRMPASGDLTRDVVLEALPQRLAEVRIVDRTGCDPASLAGFECRRDSGIGYFRDAGEIRALRPVYWADMLDGMPGLRRHMRSGPHGLDWRVSQAPSRCLVELWNGQRPMRADGAPFQPDESWKPNDVVAIEYYEKHADVPPHYEGYAWTPPPGGQPCGLIVYWLRGAARGTNRDARRAGDPVRKIIRP